MTRRTKIFVWTIIIFVSLLMLVYMCAIGIAMTYYAASRWDPNAQEDAIWRSTDGTIVLDFHDDEVSGNSADDGYIISGDTRIYIEDVSLYFIGELMYFRDPDLNIYVAFECKFKNKSKFTATVIEIMDERFNFLNIGDKFVFIKDQE